ncbi:hypothetical protein LTR56_017201 [Elasticomyces elasticus]|nr:hypothetical protein LTR56_017201 [Elasticomyces elasticus]KAK3666317.1 hypothetical protein LTR22_002981 [Elasticomyces elasticus]KAK4926913.1 hypothetical protein LTR49_006329 [Elasticomyces elasticus]
MDSPNFRLPGVTNGLRPYIRPRDEATQIRNDLQSSLQNHTGSDGTTLTSTNITRPKTGKGEQTSLNITGVRRAYLKALEAHTTAQSRYDALKADLEQLSKSTRPDGPRTSDGPSSVDVQYIPMLRQREKRRRLLVIERAYSSATDVGAGFVDGHLDDVVKQHAGDLPTPPMIQTPAFNDKPDVEARIVSLKKSVLVTRQAVNVRFSAARESSAVETIGPGDETAGLQSALNELTGWMERQLGVIGDAEGDVQATPAKHLTNGHAVQTTPDVETIAKLYDNYLDARQRLVHTTASPMVLDVRGPNRKASGTDLQPSGEQRGAASIVLPYIDTLSQAKQEERTLLQQSTHLRRQIAASESETQRLLARLADESHLVHPGASGGRDWANAAESASGATKDFAVQRLQAGVASTDVAAQSLEQVRGVPGLLDHLAGQDR